MSIKVSCIFFTSNFAGAVTGTFRRARRVGMQHCAADALNLVPQWDGCAHAPWIERAAQLHHASSSVADGSPVSNIVVGANKGYDAPSFLSLWSHSLAKRLGGHTWKHLIMAYARGLAVDKQLCASCTYAPASKRKHNFLRMFPTGPCKDEANIRHAKHARSRLVPQVHLLELLPSNRQLIRWLVNRTDIASFAHVHDLAASNVSSTAFSAPDESKYAGIEALFLFVPWNLKEKKRSFRTGATIETTTIDDFMARKRLSEAWLVQIDTEGWDALVLEGMRKSLAAKRIAFVEFEYSGRNYWSPASGADRRTLEQTQRWLGELGYTCFLQTSFDLAPISGPCWRAEFERRHWSNVLCAGREAELSLLYNISAEGKARRGRMALLSQHD